MDAYFERKEVSNSDLSKLKRQLTGADYIEPVKAYAFGTLIDAMVTEPHRIDWYRQLIDGLPLYGSESQDSEDDWNIALKMYKSLTNDNRVMGILKGANFQKISIARRDFTYKPEGYKLAIDFSLDCRCKWDFFGNISGDLKSTTATTQKQFEAACYHFDYYRSRAWYMDIEATDRDIIIGCSKVNQKIFFVPIRRDDKFYKLGKQQYTELAFKWWMLNA